MEEVQSQKEKFCKQCGTANPTEANFCMHCSCAKFVDNYEEYEIWTAEKYVALVGELKAAKKESQLLNEKIENLEQQIAKIDYVQKKHLTKQARQVRESCLAAVDMTMLDPLCKKALRYWLKMQNGHAAISTLQRGLKIGFNRAGRIFDTLQELHLVQQTDEHHCGPLFVLIDDDELDLIFPTLEDYN